MAAQIRLLYEPAAVIVIHLIVAPITAALLWYLYPPWIAIGWLALVAAVVAARLALRHLFQRQNPADGEAERWGRRFAIANVAMGSLWGALGSVILLNDDAAPHLFVAFLCGGLAAASALRNSPYLPALYGFAAPTILPGLAAYLARGTIMSLTMGVLLFVYALVLVLLGRENNRRIVENIRMRLEQTDLNAELRHITCALTKEIADHRKVAAELEESSERFRAIAENAQDPIIISDSNDRVIYWNRAAERTFGYTQAEVMGRSAHALLVPEQHRAKAIEGFKRFAETGQGEVLGKTRPFTALRKDGTEFPIEISVSAMRLRGAWHAVGIARDVTERETIETALRERGNELREAQRLAHLGSWTWQADTDVLEWSVELYRVFDRDPGLPAPTIQEHAHFLTPESFARLMTAMSACQNTGAPYEVDLEGTRPDGSRVWISARGEAQRVDGRTVRVRGTAQDITARKQAEAKSLEAEATFRALVEQGMSGIVIISEDGTLAYLNPRFAEMIGYERASAAIGRPMLEFAADDDKPAISDALQAIFSGEAASKEVAITILRKQGDAVATLTQGARANFGGKSVAILVFLDITERKRSEEKIQKLHDQMSATIEALRRRDRYQTSIAKLSDILQSCHSQTEAYPIIASTARTLFHGTDGAVALVANEMHELETVAEWGAEKANLPRFSFDDCWAMRTGQRYEVDAPGSGAVCRHFNSAPQRPYICLPLTVHGETSGLLHLGLHQDSVIDDELRHLMQNFGDVVKLSLSNLKLRETLSRQAMQDALTGLFNRHYLTATLPREINRARRAKTPLSLAMMDIDHFKRFNDAHGHDAGDVVLRELGAILRRSMRSGDMACRYGGEEILLVLLNCDLKSAMTRLEQICLDIKTKTFLFRGLPLSSVTVSVGLAQLDSDLATADSLITAADEALYTAKRNGRDRIELFSNDIQQKARAINA